ncbi:unnamed protein product [Caenorhabditis auriculariae]|uniref:DUF229 domain containing protein n=1 Tax=Caenorhabditis auriculariae TaxID=2777116 RepID=A0A8S1HDX4_9PELO|nr:unnamed protein product [Caenorhabditis auriculariae]
MKLHCSNQKGALLIAVCTTIYIYYFLLITDKKSYYSKRRAPPQRTCSLPKLNPWDPTILGYIDPEVTTLRCHEPQVQPEVTYLDDNGFLHINHSEAVKVAKNVSCRYRTFDKKQGQDNELEYTEWTAFEKPTRINAEFVEVSCERTSFIKTTVYSNNHNQLIPHKSDFEKTLPSVLIIVLDSVSHSNFVRTLKKTLEVLKTEYNSFIFDGMNKIGDHSFSNAVAFMAGKMADREFGDVLNYFDDHALIWKDFAKTGYKTFYSEDYPAFNLFNYLSKGFKTKPVDHYLRPFWLNIYGSYVHRRSANLCYGNQAMHRLQLRYFSQFLKAYRGEPKFGISWFTELGHDYLNQVSVGDADLAEFLVQHKAQLTDSFLIVMSDHGHRFDAIRRTTVGRLEERMPFFSLSVPKRLRNEHLDNVLTTFWDVYVTLREICTLADEGKIAQIGSPRSKVQLPSYSDRGQSLFEPIPERNCEEAGVPDEFCVCEKEFDTDTNDSKIKDLGNSLVQHINTILESYKDCAKLELKQVHSATIFENEEEERRRYRLAVEVLPSRGIFEALMQVSEDEIKVVGDINRINKYGNQSICVDQQFIRKLCYCQ